MTPSTNILTCRKQITLLLIIACFFADKAFSQTKQVDILSLDTILTRIERQHIKLKAYDLRSKSFAYRAKASSAWMAPMVGAGTFMTPYPGQRPMEDGDKGSIMFNVEQEIPNPAKQKANSRYIASQSASELANREIDLNSLRTEAKKLYYTWIIAEKRIQLLKDNEQVIQSMKKLEAIRYEYNQAQLSNVFKADAELEANRNMLQMQEAEISRSRAWLNSLMSVSGDNPFKVDTNLVPAFIPQARLDTLLLAQRRKDIQKMNAEMQTMRYGIDVMRHEQKPDFKIRFDHMAPLGKMMPNAYSVMGMISIPIVPWSSKMYKNEAKAMQLELEAMQAERKSMLIESQGMLYGMQAEITTMQERIDRIAKKVIPALQRAMEANFQSYRENKQELPLVLADWEALNMMKNTLLDEQLKMYLMIADYEKELFN
ncbi:TolC family protein [Olivibacter sp. XZL3]|uniref:TolC family protein n=1 Tax=Olivibacter sp. XZL3 TaxID=1735116 RepID=UPI001F10AB13|nr:TolC family protein [Olivibacter sp. XZL3]